MYTSTKLSANQKGFSPILLILLIAVVLGGYFIYQNLPKTTTSPPVDNPSQTDQPLQATSPTNNYCKYKSNTILAKDCGDFLILEQGCCDIPDIILDKSGNKIMECGGIAGYSDECKKRFLPQTNCIEIQCNQN